MYQNAIREQLRIIGRSDIDPRHVEGCMRLLYKTLDHLTQDLFNSEVMNAVTAIDSDPELAEAIARSYGL